MHHLHSDDSALNSPQPALETRRSEQQQHLRSHATLAFAAMVHFAKAQCTLRIAVTPTDPTPSVGAFSYTAPICHHPRIALRACSFSASIHSPAGRPCVLREAVLVRLL